MADKRAFRTALQNIRTGVYYEHLDDFRTLILNGFVTDKNGNVPELCDDDDKFLDVVKDALDDGMFIRESKNGKPFYAITDYDHDCTFVSEKPMDAKSFIKQFPVPVKEPKSPGVGSWIGHFFSRMVGGKGNDAVNTYYEKRQDYAASVYAKLKESGFEAEKSSRVKEWEMRIAAYAFIGESPDDREARTLNPDYARFMKDSAAAELVDSPAGQALIEQYRVVMEKRADGSIQYTDETELKAKAAAFAAEAGKRIGAAQPTVRPEQPEPQTNAEYQAALETEQKAVRTRAETYNRWVKNRFEKKMYWDCMLDEFAGPVMSVLTSGCDSNLRKIPEDELQAAREMLLKMDDEALTELRKSSIRDPFHAEDLLLKAAHEQVNQQKQEESQPSAANAEIKKNGEEYVFKF
ncbi:MAG: hypothetical protein MJ192_08245 [Clostridia bacterium]|nr:hypothetical protein [Clostridia bacterium]